MEEVTCIFIWKNGGRMGPFSARTLADSIRLGSLSPDTPAWTKDDPTWRSAAEILKRVPPQDCNSMENRPNLQPSMSSSPGNFSSPHRFGERLLMVILSSVGFLVIVLIFILFNRIGDSPHGPPDKTVADVAPKSSETTAIDAPEAARCAVSIEEAEKCVLMARSREASGSAFIATDGDKTYVYTNVHVASFDSLEFSDFQGRIVKVSNIGEVVAMAPGTKQESGIDIVRFPTLDTPALALRFADRQAIEEKPEVWTLGDSGGERILKTLGGHIKGFGPDKIEVDCEFIPGNSGGPIVTSQAEVVGIASYMTSDTTIWARGTQNEVRRIAWIPGHDFHWIETTTSEMAKERTMAQGCLRASAALCVILQLRLEQDGLRIPDDFSIQSKTLLTMAEGHELLNILEQTNKKIERISNDLNAGPNRLTTVLQFLETCSKYQERQLNDAENRIRSSFWKNELDKMIANHRNLLKEFNDRLSKFRESGVYGGSLGGS